MELLNINFIAVAAGINNMLDKLCGSLMQGDSLPMALDRATQFILQGLRATFGYEYDNREGILLEKVLHNLDMPIQMASYELI